MEQQGTFRRNELILLLDIATDWSGEEWKCKLGRSKEEEEEEDKESMIVRSLKNGIEDAPIRYRFGEIDTEESGKVWGFAASHFFAGKGILAFFSSTSID